MGKKSKVVTSTTSTSKINISLESEVSLSPSSLKDRVHLQRKLSNPARHGVNTSVYGLVTLGISDHLPITFNFLNYNVLSWNMLANTHLYNALHNVTGLQDLTKSCSDANSYKRRMIHFLADFSRFIMKTNQDGNGEIKLSTVLFDEYIKMKADNAKPEEKDKLKKDLAELRDVIMEDKNTYAHTINHAVSIVYQIEHGELSKRTALLLENKKLLSDMVKKDIICLQECTNPDEILKMLNGNGQKFNMIKHRVNEHRSNTDHCVIIYNSEKLEISSKNSQPQVIKGALDTRPDGSGGKPYIMARFKDTNGEEFIAGSIHHPGGGKNELEHLNTEMESLKISKNEEIPIFSAGDFNNADVKINEMLNQTAADKKNLALTYITTNEGTMAGPDYGNQNLSIDGVISTESNITVKVPESARQIARPLDCPYTVTTENSSKATPKPHT